MVNASIDDAPRRPADAYHLVVRHLPPGFLDKAPPPAGVWLHAMGRDRVRSSWRMPAGVAAQVRAALNVDPLVSSCWITTKPPP